MMKVITKLRPCISSIVVLWIKIVETRSQQFYKLFILNFYTWVINYYLKRKGFVKVYGKKVSLKYRVRTKQYIFLTILIYGDEFD